jgi:hypothetical protein
MSSILSETSTREQLEMTLKIELMSRGRRYYRDPNPPSKEFDEEGEIVQLMSRGVAYRKTVVPKTYKKPDFINWRWRCE